MGLACVRGRTDHECHRDLRECPSGHRSRRTVLRLNRSNDDDVTWQCASAGRRRSFNLRCYQVDILPIFADCLSVLTSVPDLFARACETILIAETLYYTV
jgi:hypothetical protein